MRINKLLVTLAFSTLFGNGVAVASGDASEIESEPIRCYILATAAASLPKGQAVKLCSGTTDGIKVFKCFMNAVAPTDEGGLDLPMGFAINLCKTNS